MSLARASLHRRRQRAVASLPGAALSPPEQGPVPVLVPDRFWFCVDLPLLSPPPGPAPDPGQAVLRQLATWAGRYTPAVSLAFPGALLLEVRASLALFGGPEGLRQRLLRGLRSRSHRPVIVGAPTARGAWWLARASQGLPQPAGKALVGQADLARRLASLPIAATGWPARALELLARMGVVTLGDCRRLPRQGFARRLGQGLLRDLDQAFGRAPEVCRWHEPPGRFRETLDLEEEARDTQVLLPALEPLLARLGERLQVHQAGLRILWCRLGHRMPVDGRQDEPAGRATDPGTWLRVGLARPSGNAALIASLLRIRLEAVRLLAPVVSLLLLADLEEPAAPGGHDLLGQPLVPGAALADLMDRLQARLGEQALHGLAMVPEHRPEEAWQPVPPLPGSRPAFRPAAGAGDAGAVDARQNVSCLASGIPGSRPLWLLPAPRRLATLAERPAWRGPLHLEEGPERIETGWWDGSDVRRDYYRARCRDGGSCWVFQDLRTGAWYLQGIFG